MELPTNKRLWLTNSLGFLFQWLDFMLLKQLVLNFLFDGEA